MTQLGLSDPQLVVALVSSAASLATELPPVHHSTAPSRRSRDVSVESKVTSSVDPGPTVRRYAAGAPKAGAGPGAFADSCQRLVDRDQRGWDA
jgi:hypothetical protein